MKRALLTGMAVLGVAASGSDSGDILPIAVDRAGTEEIIGAGGVFALIALCSINITRTAAKRARRKLASISALRSAWHLAVALRNRVAMAAGDRE